ncbi:uncharacterized protein LOC109602627 [Aethina tumida]|uniref:uncharacterized protein LOC109602627 n=1 Tax=Aethina tumida TaxID=116153 RepID=UPI002147E043|nr:uncharacterized protein LOC109602627 [Aethina tumida]
MSRGRTDSTTKIFVGSLAPNVTTEELRGLFSSYGAIVECDISKKCGFLHMENEQLAEQAIEDLNGTEFMGRVITVERGRDKPKRPMRGGKDRGGPYARGESEGRKSFGEFERLSQRGTFGRGYGDRRSGGRGYMDRRGAGDSQYEGLCAGTQGGFWDSDYGDDQASGRGYADLFNRSIAVKPRSASFGGRGSAGGYGDGYGDSYGNYGGYGGDNRSGYQSTRGKYGGGRGWQVDNYNDSGNGNGTERGYDSPYSMMQRGGGRSYDSAYPPLPQLRGGRGINRGGNSPVMRRGTPQGRRFQ